MKKEDIGGGVSSVRESTDIMASGNRKNRLNEKTLGRQKLSDLREEHVPKKNKKAVTDPSLSPKFNQVGQAQKQRNSCRYCYHGPRHLAEAIRNLARIIPSGDRYVHRRFSLTGCWNKPSRQFRHHFWSLLYRS